MGGGSSRRRSAVPPPPPGAALGAERFRRLLRASAPDGCEGVLREAGRGARELGVRVALVGGAVRDLLLGRSLTEPDLVVEGDASALARLLVGRFGGALSTHARFGTASIRLPDGFRIDVGTARRETYASPAALPTVEPASFDEDALRRDFTINTLRIDLGPAEFGTLHDPLGGIADLRRRRLHVLHDGSFVDDPTRAYRAVRFAARLGFRIDAGDARLIDAALSGGAFERLTPKRLRSEIERLYNEEDPLAVTRLLSRHRLLEPLAGGLNEGADVRPALRRAARLLDLPEVAAVGPERWVVHLLVLAWPLSAGAALGLATRLQPERRARQAIEGAGPATRAIARRLAAGSRPSRVRKLCAARPPEVSIAAAARLPGAVPALRGFLGRWRDARAEIGGKDLLAAGVPAGPALARGLEAALAARLDRGAGPEEQLRAALAAVRRSPGRP